MTSSPSLDPSKKAPIQLWLIHLVSLLGLFLAAYLTQHFYEIQNGTLSSFQSFCNIAEKLNCDVVTASAYAELFPGFPIAAFATGWFLSFFIISLLVHFPTWRREAVRALLGITTIGVLTGIPYFFIMAFQIRTFCLFCILIDSANLLGLFLVLTLKPDLKFKKPQGFDFRKGLALAGITGILVSITVLGLRGLNQSSLSEADIERTALQILQSPVMPLKTGDVYPALGPSNAPLTIVEFSDFQCPFCRIAALSLDAVLKKYPSQVRVEFRNFPLDQTCNFGMSSTPHPAACESARVAMCASRQGKFEAAYQKLFERQAALMTQHPSDLVQGAGLDMKALESCLRSDETTMSISRDIEESRVLEIRATPTFFINGHKVEGALPPGVWRYLIETLLKQAK